MADASQPVVVTPEQGAPGSIPEPLPFLTAKQFAVLQWIFEYFSKRQRYPTSSEIAQAFGFRRSRAQCVVSVLSSKGFLLRLSDERRGNMRFTALGKRILAVEGVDVAAFASGQLPLFQEQVQLEQQIQKVA